MAAITAAIVGALPSLVIDPHRLTIRVAAAAAGIGVILALAAGASAACFSCARENGIRLRKGRTAT